MANNYIDRQTEKQLIDSWRKCFEHDSTIMERFQWKLYVFHLFLYWCCCYIKFIVNKNLELHGICITTTGDSFAPHSLPVFIGHAVVLLLSWLRGAIFD